MTNEVASFPVFLGHMAIENDFFIENDSFSLIYLSFGYWGQFIECAIQLSTMLLSLQPQTCEKFATVSLL